MANISDIYQGLQKEIESLEKVFISKWLPARPENAPEDFQYDVKAYCVLAHAAFEEYVEDLSLIALEEARQGWLKKEFSAATVSLLMFYKASLEAIENEDEPQERVFDIVRMGIDDCAKKHSQALSQNHGFSLKYLRRMLIPVGIDVPSSVKLTASLGELAEARGSYAHTRAARAHYGQWKRASRPMSPEKAKETVEDCLALCCEIGKKVGLTV